MATTKKTASKKAASHKTKAAPTKKTAATKVVKKATSKSKTPSKRIQADNMAMRSFRVSPDPYEFTSLRFTRQTFYWLLIALFLICVQLWILKLQLDVVAIVDAQQQQIQNF